MRSHAEIKSHPIHPMLIVFPIAFGIGAPCFDLIGVLAGWPSVWSTGAHLSVGAVIGGLIAGVPGFIDYLYTVPPNSSGSRRAKWHLGVNLCALGLIAAGWIFRDLSTLRPGVATIVLEFAGFGLMAWGGWMGGTLVYRNQIGVDHRYADAGNWKEAEVGGSEGEWADVAGADEMEVGQMKLVRAGGRRIVLARTAEGYTACDDHCTHRGGSLADGTLIRGTIACPWHGSQFDTRTGEVKAGPATEPIATHRVEVRDGRVLLAIAGT